MGHSNEINNKIVALLEKAIVLHSSETSHYCIEIIRISEKIAEILEQTNQCDQILSIARNLTDGWGDSCNHEWKYYEGIQQEDWPILTKKVIDYIRNGNEITDSILLKFLLT